MIAALTGLTVIDPSQVVWYDFHLRENVGCRQLEYSVFSSHFCRVSHYAWKLFYRVIQDDSTRKVSK
jgi:hypothetical protein